MTAAPGRPGDAGPPPLSRPGGAIPPAGSAIPPASSAIPPAGSATPPAGGSGPPTGRRKRNWRWLRLVLPFAVVLLLIGVSVVTYAVQEPDPTDAAFLSPVSDAPLGGSRLARLLADRGIDVQRATRTSDALVSAYAGDTTLFVPAPDLVHPFYLRMLKLMPATTRVVLVSPGGRALADGRLPVAVSHRRWAAAHPVPGCALPAAVAAGRATALRTVFARVNPAPADRVRCYSGGLVVTTWFRTELTFVGATDAFRNDRIREYGNAALATGLLTGGRRVIWLDIHRREPRPGYVDDPRAAANGPAPPSLGPGSPDPDFPLGNTGPDPADRPPVPAGGNGAGDGNEPPNPLWTAFPSSWYAGAALLLLAALLLALAAGRRLGVPVPEPMPVSVRVTETVEGRGRLYARARARGPALATLRAAARDRLVRLLGLPADADRAAVTEAVTARAGGTVDVEATLFGPEPADDDELVRAAIDLESLVQRVGRTGSAGDHHAEPRDEDWAPDEGETR
jgi:hypothetical protein